MESTFRGILGATAVLINGWVLFKNARTGEI